MVTQLVVEDEYTINVKLRRPLTNGSCLPPPTITITPDDPTITILPPPNVSLTHAQAAKSVNGAPPMVVGCSTDLSKPFPLEGPSWCRYKADDDLNDLKPQQLSIMPPPPSTPASPPPPPVRRTYLEERVSDDKVTHGCLRLPLVQVFSDDNMLVATNKFSTPSEPPSSSSFRLQPATSSFKSNSPSSHALAPPPQLQEPHPTAPGSLYVERIPAHCKSDSGVLYVPPVDERRLRRSKQDEPPAKGNSRRTRAKVNDVASPSPPPPPPPPATSVTWTPPERVPPRSSSSKAAARALLAEVLSPRIENQLQHRPPSPRPQRPSANYGIYRNPNFDKSNRFSSNGPIDFSPSDQFMPFEKNDDELALNSNKKSTALLNFSVSKENKKNASHKNTTRCIATSLSGVNTFKNNDPVRDRDRDRGSLVFDDANFPVHLTEIENIGSPSEDQ